MEFEKLLRVRTLYWITVQMLLDQKKKKKEQMTPGGWGLTYMCMKGVGMLVVLRRGVNFRF